MSSESESPITEAQQIGNIFGNLNGVATCESKFSPPNGQYIRHHLYLKDDANPLEVLTLAKLNMSGKDGDAWVENEGQGGIITIGTNGLNPEASSNPPLSSY